MYIFIGQRPPESVRNGRKEAQGYITAPNKESGLFDGVAALIRDSPLLNLIFGEPQRPSGEVSITHGLSYTTPISKPILHRWGVLPYKCVVYRCGISSYKCRVMGLLDSIKTK